MHQARPGSACSYSTGAHAHHNFFHGSLQRRSVMVLTRKISAVAAAVLIAACGVAFAQSYPSKTVHLIVPYPAGGGYDRLARLIGPKLSDRLGQPVIVENRPGAGGTLAMA